MLKWTKGLVHLLDRADGEGAACPAVHANEPPKAGRGRTRIEVGTTHWLASLPPPNRACGSPAHGSPVSGLLLVGDWQLPLVDPSWELPRMALHGSSPRPFHLPAALHSTGRYPASHHGPGLSGVGFPAGCLRYDGGSDCCPAPLARIPARTALNAST